MGCLVVAAAHAQPLPDQLRAIARDVGAGTAALLTTASQVSEQAPAQQRLEAWRGVVVAALWDDAGLEDRRAVEEQALAVLPRAIALALQLNDQASLGVLLAYQATAGYWQSFRPRVDKPTLERALSAARASGDPTAECVVLLRRGIAGFAFEPASQWVTSTLAAARLTGADPICRATAFYVTNALNGYGGADDNPDAAARAARDVDEAARMVPFDQYPSLGHRLLVAREYQRLADRRPEVQSTLQPTAIDGPLRMAIARGDVGLQMAARVFKAVQESASGHLDAALQHMDAALAVQNLGIVGRLAVAEWGMSIYSQRPATHGKRARELAERALQLLGNDATSAYLATYYGASSVAMAAVGDYKRAYEDQIALDKHRAAIMMEGQIAAINEANIRFDVERKEFENKRLSLRRNLLTVLLGLSSIALCVVGWLLYRQVVHRRRISRLYKQLDDRNRDLEALSASRSEFLAGACHDLRQPAHALSLLTEVAASRPDTGAKYLDDIRRNSLVLADMLSALLDITQLERGDYAVHLAPVNLGPLLEEVKVQYGNVATHKGLSLQVVPTDLWVTSDVYLLRRVLFNLVSNACKYTDRGGVQVCVRAVDGERARLQVIDTGRGIPAHRQADMLKPYTRIDHGAKEEGLGIGLSVVQRATQLLSHALAIDSQVGSGTTVSITLPCCAPVPVAKEASTAITTRPDTRVIVVEDNQDVRQALSELLSSWGFRVIEAESADALARQLVGDHAACPALTIVDYSIGRDDGLSIVRRLRQRPGWSELPAILVTGAVSAEIDQRARDMGVLVLLKPTRPAQLLRVVERALTTPVSAAIETA